MLHEQKVDLEEAEGLLDALRSAPEPLPTLDIEYVTANSQTQRMLEKARKAASSDSPVLIVGEVGTGKELLARMVHQASPRRDKPFICVNCASVPAALMESQLFGHERGAFTGANVRQEGLTARIDGGTLFLDEIGALPTDLQVKLLRFAQNGEYERIGGSTTFSADARIISASHKNLKGEVEAKRFRHDLFYRLSTVTLEILPLRERPEDIPVLVEHFIRTQAARMNRPVPDVTQNVMETLRDYRWPGNVRELASVLERALTLCDGDAIDTIHLPDALAIPDQPASTSEKQPVKSITQIDDGPMEDAHKHMIQAAYAFLREVAKWDEQATRKTSGSDCEPSQQFAVEMDGGIRVDDDGEHHERVEIRIYHSTPTGELAAGEW